MKEKLFEIEKRYLELQTEMIKPENLSSREIQAKLGKEMKSLEPIVSKFKEYKLVEDDLNVAREMIETASGDDRAIIEDELNSLQAQMTIIEEEIKELLTPRDPRDDKSVIMEIRAGTGGEEAALFALDLFNMYSRYAERMGWKLDLINFHESETGGAKEIIFSIEGKGAFSVLKFEAGTHRVQRVPETESQGRIHTSAVTVAVLSEPDDVDININPDDLRIDVYRSSGAGGQKVNKTSSAIRVTHIPTGLVVTCQDQRSQHQNKDKALMVLRAHLQAIEESKRESEVVESRRSMVGTGDRSEKIRTYNFPQSRVTDHRVGFTTHNLNGFLMGELEEMHEALRVASQAEALASGKPKK